VIFDYLQAVVTLRRSPEDALRGMRRDVQEMLPRA
jgi:hypothetical protein